MIAAAVGISAAASLACLEAALQTGTASALWGFWLGLAAAVASVRAGLGRRMPAGVLRLAPDGSAQARPGQAAGGSVELRPVCVTGQVIYLAPTDRRRPGCAIWRDSVQPDGFRRLAALGHWRRRTRAGNAESPESPESPELIARDAVRRTRVAPRPGWPRTE